MDCREFVVADNLREEATALIKQLEIVERLAKLGEVTFQGSYRHNLIVWPDIDIAVYGESFKQEAIGNFASKLLAETNPYWLKVTDFTRTKREPGFPNGIYFGLKYSYNNLEWKIDIWLLSDNKQKTDELDIWLDSLSVDQRRTILQLKTELLATGRYPGKRDNSKSISSVEVYQAVRSGARTVNELDKWLEQVATGNK